jgi:hypothetical protein
MNETHLVFGVVIALLVVIAVVGVVLFVDFVEGLGSRTGDEDLAVVPSRERDARDAEGNAVDLEAVPVPTVAELRRKIEEAPADELRQVLDEIASPEVLFGRDALLQATAEWISEGNATPVRWAALALLRNGNPDGALADLFEACSVSILLADGSLNRREVVERLGYQIAMLLENRNEEERIPTEQREEILHALVRFGGLGPLRDRGIFVASALGGATEEDRFAVGHLGVLFRESLEPAVQALAVRHLGKVGTVHDVLELTGFRLDPPPSSPEDAEVCGGFLIGLHLAVTRHPDEVAVAQPVFDAVLRKWNRSEEQDRMRLDLLELLAHHPVPPLAATLDRLATDPNAAVAAAAEKALEALFRN